MSNDELTVTVKNRLGMRYGLREINVKENGAANVSYKISPGQDVKLPTKKVSLQSIHLEALQAPGGIANRERLIPVTIDSPDHYHVSVKQVAGDDKWELEFKEVPKVSPPTASATEISQSESKSNVNATIGQDEPPGTALMASTCCLLTTVGIAAAWLVSPYVMGFSSILWYAVPIASLVIGFLGWFRFRKKKGKETDRE